MEAERERGGTYARRKRIDADTVHADLLRHGAAHLVDGGFAGVVGAAGQASVGDAAGHGSDEDNAALGFVGDHVVCYGFGCDEGSWGG